MLSLPRIYGDYGLSLSSLKTEFGRGDKTPISLPFSTESSPTSPYVFSQDSAQALLKPPPFKTFLKTKVHITDATTKALIPWEWWPVHDQMCADLSERRLVVLKARQVSWSWLLAAWAVHGCLDAQYFGVLVISKGEDEAADFLKKCSTILTNLPVEERPTLRRNNTELIEFASGSWIKAFPATANAGRSYTGSLVIVDEAAFHPYAGTDYVAYKPSIDAGGQLIIVSTANGVGNWFHQMYLGGRGRTNNFAARFYGWNVRPGRDDAWYAGQKIEYANSPVPIDQEYPTNDDDAFILSGNPRFDVAAIKIHRERKRDPLPASALSPALQRLPGLSVWALPVPGQPYVMGSDVAEGLEGGDFSVTMVLNARTLEHVASLHGTWQPGTFAEYSIALGYAYNTAFWGWERNNHGHTVTRVADVEYHYPRMYWHEEREANQRQRQEGNQTTRRLGFPTTSATKPGLIDDLDEVIRSFALTSYDDGYWSECQTYVRGPNGDTNASESNHDDRVMAMGIARRMARQPGAQSMRVEPTQEQQMAQQAAIRQRGGYVW